MVALATAHAPIGGIGFRVYVLFTVSGLGHWCGVRQQLIAAVTHTQEGLGNLELVGF